MADQEKTRRDALIVSGDALRSRELRGTLEDEGWRTIVANSVGPARKLVRRGGLSLLVIDEDLLADADRVLHEAMAEAGSATPVLILGEDGDATTPARFLAPAGYIVTPVDARQLRDALQTATPRDRAGDPSEILGRSEAIEEVRRIVEQIAPTPVNVLITGESGTGKSMIADVIHRRSARIEGPLLTLNCGAIPETLLESELFGHERGAFTDARTMRRGLFEAADGGTVFLDEIGEMSLSAQVRLLHVLEEREITRVGSSTPMKVNVRVLAATNQDLQQAVAAGRFRRDLYYRLKVVEIRIPPLRARREDIGRLADHFIQSISEEHGVPPIRFDDAASRILENYEWPGNIRELKNLIERLMVLSVDRIVSAGVIGKYLDEFDADPAPKATAGLPMRLDKTPEESSRDLLYWAILEVARDIKELKAFLMDGRPNQPIEPLPVYQANSDPVVEEGIDAEYAETGGSIEDVRPMRDVEREAILQALQATNGHRKKAARLLDMAERTLYRKIRQFGL